MAKWLDQMFNANQVISGGIIRRSVQDVLKYSSIGDVVDRAKENGWHVILNGDQIVVLCNPGEVKILC